MFSRLAFATALSLVLANSAATTCHADPSTEKEVKEKPKLYDREADGNTQIEEALKIAKAENKRVLLKFGANWCGWCHRLSKCFKTEPDIAAALKEGYVLVLIDVDAISDEDDTQHNADVIERYGKPTKHGLPVLVVLDADGQQLHTQDTALLEEGDHHDPAKVLAFLEEWKVGARAGD